jgi:hypothetical protein
MTRPFAIQGAMRFQQAVLLHPSSRVGPEPVHACLTGHAVVLTVSSTGHGEPRIHATMAEVEEVFPEPENVGSVTGTWSGFGEPGFVQPDAEIRLDEQPAKIRNLPGTGARPNSLQELIFAPITVSTDIVCWRLWSKVECGGELHTQALRFHTTASMHWHTFSPDGSRRVTPLADIAPGHWQPHR